MTRIVEVGKILSSNRCGDFKILEVLGAYSKVVFINTGWEGVFQNKHIKDGKIKDQKAPLTFGVGYTDGEITKRNKKHLPFYNYWKQILERGHCPKLKEKYPSYENVTVCPEWHSLKTFKVWFEDNYIEGYDLDKDLLCKGKGKKIYSPETCVFLPRRVNTLLINKYTNRRGKNLPIGVTQKSEKSKYCARCHVGEKQPHVIGYFYTIREAFLAYKYFKEDYIHTLAEEYYSKGEICDKSYQSLKQFEVEEEYH